MEIIFKGWKRLDGKDYRWPQVLHSEIIAVWQIVTLRIPAPRQCSKAFKLVAGSLRIGWSSPPSLGWLWNASGSGLTCWDWKFRYKWLKDLIYGFSTLQWLYMLGKASREWRVPSWWIYKQGMLDVWLFLWKKWRMLFATQQELRCQGALHPETDPLQSCLFYSCQKIKIDNFNYQPKTTTFVL